MIRSNNNRNAPNENQQAPQAFLQDALRIIAQFMDERRDLNPVDDQEQREQQPGELAAAHNQAVNAEDRQRSR